MSKIGSFFGSLFGGGGGGGNNAALMIQQQQQQAQINKMNAENAARQKAEQEAYAREQANLAARKGRAAGSYLAGYDDTAAPGQRSQLGVGSAQ